MSDADGGDGTRHAEPAGRSGGRDRRGAVGRWPLLVPALVAVAFLLVPLAAMLLRAPGAASGRSSRTQAVLEALRLSLCASPAPRRSRLVVGVPLAWVLARADFPGRVAVRALVTLPLVLPPVVGGVALLLAFGRQRPGRPVPRPLVRHHAPVHHGRRGRRRDLRRDAVPRHHRRGGAARRRPRVRGGRRHARARRAADVFRRVTLPAGRARRSWPGRCCAGPGRSASSARRSRSPATSRAAPRRCRSRSTSPSRADPDAASCSAWC